MKLNKFSIMHKIKMKNKITILISIMLFSANVNAQDSIFDFKERQEIEELPDGERVVAQGENSLITSHLDEIDFSFFDDERKRIIEEIIERTMIDFFFHGEDPRMDSFREDYQYIDFEGSSIIGEVDQNYLIRLSNGQTEFVSKSYYRQLRTNNATNAVIDEIEGSINLRSRESGRDLMEQERAHRNNLRTRGN